MVLTLCEYRLASFGFTSMAVVVKVDSENTNKHQTTTKIICVNCLWKQRWEKKSVLLLLYYYTSLLNPIRVWQSSIHNILYYTPVNTTHVCSWFYETPCVGRIAHFSNSIRPELPDHMIICTRACVCVCTRCV